MTIRDILNILFKRKLVVGCFFLAAVVGGYAGLKLVSPTYESTARLLVRIGQEDIYMPALPSSQFRTPMMSVVREEQLHSESSILTSVDLAQKVVAEATPQRLFPGIDINHPWYAPKGWVQMAKSVYTGLEDYFFPLSSDRTLEAQAINRFLKDLDAEAIKSSNIIEVSLRSKVPESAALGVNTLVRQYLSERVRIYQREQAGFFTDQLSQLDTQLAATEKAVDTFRSEKQIVDVDKQRSQQMERLGDIRKNIDGLQVSVGQADRQNQVLRQQLASVPATAQLSGAESANNFSISEMNKQLADLQRKEADIVERFSPTDPRLRSVREEMAVVQRMLKSQETQRYSSSEKGINPLHARLRDDLLQSDALLAGTRQALENWTQLERETLARLNDLNSHEAEYKRLVQQLDVLRDSRQLYLEKTEETRYLSAQAAAKIGNVSVVNWGAVNNRPVSPKLWLVLIGVLVVGLFGGIGLAFVVELLDDSLKSDSDVRRYLKLPVIAKVPELA
ncbi:GumC family protein [Aquipseudomonas ullengensis]|uniref:GumC family protein n=1 Tax=Aquipseudomonas ullengensis TaxID=2759166 RepID=A0A7W4LHX6_9GAMM|nr:GumC family protein [Pseudomonas ullengensis]MBB2493525.1 GumC family protein [Pseudomonas ullengensis]